MLGVDRFVPEEGYTFLESTWARPTFEINGIWGGFQGEGSKTIIPAGAGAKVSMRLVPDQDPLEIMRLFEQHVKAVTPPGVTVKITAHAHSGPVIVSRQSDAIIAAEKSITYAYGHKPVFVRSGGSIGVVVTMKEQLGIEEVLLIGWGNPEDGEHSPNEHFQLRRFLQGHAGRNGAHVRARRTQSIVAPATPQETKVLREDARAPLLAPEGFKAPSYFFNFKTPSNTRCFDTK